MHKLSRFIEANVLPASWWILGLALAVAAGLATDMLATLAVICFSLALMFLFRTDAPWAQSIFFYLGLATFVLITRVLFRVIFNGQSGGEDIVFSLPVIEISLGFGPPLALFGNVGVATLMAACLDGLRLAAIILAVAMANTLANPRKLLKNTPGALYEVATAISVAINLAPQLIDSIQRVRRSRSLRGRSKGVGVLASIVIPALEDTMDKSLALAASMDARGFGRRGALALGTLRLIRGLSFAAAVLLAVGAYLLVTSPEASWLPLTVILCSILALVVVVRITSKQNLRTQYRTQKPGIIDVSVWLLALVIATWPVSLGTLVEQVFAQ